MNRRIFIVWGGIILACCCLGGLGSAILVGCQKPSLTTHWEYKVLTVPAPDADPKANASVPVTEAALNPLGAQGWELVGSYEEENTVFPNFSADTKIVTGIESNVRPSQVVLLFKRPLP